MQKKIVTSVNSVKELQVAAYSTTGENKIRAYIDSRLKLALCQPTEAARMASKLLVTGALNYGFTYEQSSVV